MTSQSKVHDLVITGISTKFPDRHLPQYAVGKSPYTLSTNEQNPYLNQSNGCSFDPHCPECIRELWGPLLSPFAYLIKQNAQYFNEILMRIGHDNTNTISKSFSSKRPPKRPKLEYDDHKFLTTTGTCAFRLATVSWLITGSLGFLLLILAITMMVLKSPFVPSLIIILRMKEASAWGMKLTLQIVFIILSLIGIGKMLASVIGLLGTVHRSGKLMTGTIIFITILFLLEIGAVIYCVVSWSELTLDVENALKTSFENGYGNTTDDSITNAWDRIFQSYECCGWFGNNFTGTSWKPSIPGNVPPTCCRPGASHPGCEFPTAPPAESYINTACSNAIRENLNSTASVSIAISTIGIIIFIEIASAILTRLYSSTLQTAGRQRRSYNNRLMHQFQERLASHDQETTGDDPDSNQISSRQEQPEIDDLRQLYNQYTAFHKTPPDIDPSLMSLTPTVIQVKRPNIYSYFYYE